MATSPLLSDLTAKAYAKAPVGDVESYEKKLAVTQTYFRPDMDVMEFGCGPGTTAVRHAPHVRHIQAYDISTKMLEIAQARESEVSQDRWTGIDREIDAALEGRKVVTALQDPQHGTAHATLQARDALNGFTGHILVAFFFADVGAAPWAKAATSGIGGGCSNIGISSAHFFVSGFLGLGLKVRDRLIDLI